MRCERHRKEVLSSLVTHVADVINRSKFSVTLSNSVGKLNIFVNYGNSGTRNIINGIYRDIKKRAIFHDYH